MSTPQFILCLSVAIALIGCSKEAIEWDATKIQSWIQKEWGLDEVSVTDNKDGTCSGTGKDKTGNTFTFKIEKKRGIKELHCMRFDQNGRVIDGKVLKNY